MRSSLVVVAALLAACCTAVGCANRIDFVPGFDIERDVAYDVEACLDTACEGATLIVDGPADRAGDIEGSLTLWADADVIELALGEGDFDGSHEVSFTVRDAAGTMLADYHGTIELTRGQPNGPGCDPVCWYAEVRP